MKIFSCITVILFYGLVAFPSTPNPFKESLDSLINIYSRVINNDTDLVEHNYYINISGPKEIKLSLRDNTFCQKKSNFKPITASLLIRTIKIDLEQAFEIISNPNHPDDQELQSSTEFILDDLKQSLKGQKISVCLDDSMGPYSDGHLRTYVKVNDSIEFMFESGSPD